ncbi:MAG: L-histidine N(alpha)-methyltransferase [Bacteroidetes bacterium]|nr:L-histidine N(alpha)-methyltransferase [Bacteroidota bacterium]
MEDRPTQVAEIVAALTSVPRRIPSKYFYDETGSALFDAICELPEYYLTRTEAAIMRENAGDIAAEIGRGAALIELGSGSSTKTRILLDRLRSPAVYVPIDISEEHLEKSAIQLRSEYPELRIEAVAADYNFDFNLPRSVAGARTRVLYFPGSTFGNFQPEKGLAFLKRIRTLTGRRGALLIGLDWFKSTEVLEAAYNDSAGVTAAFNLNILSNVNRIAEGDFKSDSFRHYACLDEQEGRIEMYLVSNEQQTVSVGGTTIEIEKDEAILTEVSYKYRPEAFLKMADQAGFELERSWTDAERKFGVVFLRSR